MDRESSGAWQVNRASSGRLGGSAGPDGGRSRWAFRSLEQLPGASPGSALRGPSRHSAGEGHDADGTSSMGLAHIKVMDREAVRVGWPYADACARCICVNLRNLRPKFLAWSVRKTRADPGAPGGGRTLTLCLPRGGQEPAPAEAGAASGLDPWNKSRVRLSPARGRGGFGCDRHQSAERAHTKAMDREAVRFGWRYGDACTRCICVNLRNMRP